MQREARTGFVAIDETRVRYEARKPSGKRRRSGQRGKRRGHGRPRVAAQWIATRIAISVAIADPAKTAAIGHRHGHPKAAGSGEVTQRRRDLDALDFHQQRSDKIARESPKQPSTRGEFFLLAVRRACLEEITGW